MDANIGWIALFILVLVIPILIWRYARLIARETQHDTFTGETTYSGYTCSEVIAGVIVAVVALVGFIYAIANR